MLKDLENYFKTHYKNFVFFGTLLIASVFSILSFVPQLPFAVTYHIAFFMLIVAMCQLYVFAKKYTIPEKGIIVSKSFNENAEEIIKVSVVDGKITTLELFAYSTNTYYGAIKNSLRNNNATVDKMKILLYKAKDGEKSKFETGELVSYVSRWYTLCTDGIIGELEIRFYDFEPAFYISIYSEKFLHWGVLRRRASKKHPFDASINYAVLGHDKVGDSLISEMKDCFQNTWENHSYEDAAFIGACLKE